jgi:glycosyltransferase involved in cell wall biosynthesis
MNLALHVIARDQVKDIKRIYESYGSYFDEVCFAVDSKEAYEEVKGCGANVFLYEWDEEEKEIGFPKFDKKRNFLVENTKSEYYLRLDTDDYIENIDKLKEVFEKAKKYSVDCVYTKYIYSTDKDGNCDAFQWRETIIKKSKNHFWKKTIHENIFAENESEFKGVKDSSLVIVHKIEEGHNEASVRRNLKFLMAEFNRDKENTDPRTLSYLGRSLMGIGEFKQAAPYLQMLIMRSGWDDDVYFSYISLARCYWEMGQIDDAIECCLKALQISTEYPDAYLQLLELYIDKQDYKKAVGWGLIGVQKPDPQTMYMTDPSSYTYRAAMNLAHAYLGLGNIPLAKQFYDKAYAFAPSNEFIQSQKKLFEEAFENHEYHKALCKITEITMKRGQDKLQYLSKAIPDSLLKDSHITQVKNAITEPKVWSDKSIAVFCGQAWEEWAPPSTIKGVGGSEEAVIYLSKELTKLGYEVTVYNSCGDFMGEYEGVKYRPYYDFNQKDKFNIVIAWRNNFFSQLKVDAKQKYIWLHDVPSDSLIPPDDLNTFNKVFVLSEFHKSLLPKYIPEDKIFVTANGINLADFNVKSEIRNPKRLIYTSSYDRGIETLLRRWKEVREVHPDCEIHLFYGWETYDQMVKGGARDAKFKEMMVSLMNQEGVFEHGRVGHKRLVKEFMQSGIYVYPSFFEEISCISAMKAQACGCVPVVVNYAALKETVKEGVRIEGRADNKATMDLYINSLIDVLGDQDKQTKIREKLSEIKESFGWDKVARQWSELFSSKEVLV